MIYRGYTIKQMLEGCTWIDEKGMLRTGFATAEEAMTDIDAHKKGLAVEAGKLISDRNATVNYGEFFHDQDRAEVYSDDDKGGSKMMEKSRHERFEDLCKKYALSAEAKAEFEKLMDDTYDEAHSCGIYAGMGDAG